MMYVAAAAPMDGLGGADVLARDEQLVGDVRADQVPVDLVVLRVHGQRQRGARRQKIRAVAPRDVFGVVHQVVDERADEASRRLALLLASGNRMLRVLRRRVISRGVVRRERDRVPEVYGLGGGGGRGRQGRNEGQKGHKIGKTPPRTGLDPRLVRAIKLRYHNCLR